MIVKNESKIIIRLLESVYKIIDTYCICDTGSTDNTKSLIKDFFKKKRIKGKLIDEPFVNFEYNRNVALAACFGMSDYVMFIDADMILEYDPNFKLNLTENAYYLHQGNEDFIGNNIRFIKNDGTFKYYGVTHEVVMTTLINPVSVTIDKHNMFMRDIGDGGSKQDKYERDKRLLLAAIEKEPHNTRYYFYLGNTFKAMNDMPNAVHYYKKRIELEAIRVYKFNEEVYYSYYNIGVCLNNEESVYYWITAHKYSPKRVEHLHELMRFYRLRKEYELCMVFYNMAKLNLAPPFKLEDAHNFIFSSIVHYRFLIDYEYTLFACYLGIKTANYNILKVFNDCDEKDSAYTNTLINIKFYKNILKPTFNLDFTEQILVNSAVSMISSSASIIPHLGGYMINTRYVNYRITPPGAYVKYGTTDTPCDNIITINKCSILDNNLKLTSSKYLETVTDNKYIVGIEDVKIHKTGDKIVFIGSAQYENTIMMKYGDYNPDSNKLDGEFMTCDFIKSVKEKNWVFVPNSQNEIIYNWYPLTLCTINNNTLSISRKIPTPYMFKLFRGSSNGVLFNDEIWFITHFVSDETIRYYYNVFVIFDKDMNLQRYSPPFNFSDRNIEFCLSLIVEENRIIIPHSVNDATTYIGIYDKKMIDDFIKQ